MNARLEPSEATFAEAMQRRGIEKKARSVGRVYPGIVLLVDERNAPRDPEQMPDAA